MTPAARAAALVVGILLAALLAACDQATPTPLPSTSAAVRASEVPSGQPSADAPSLPPAATPSPSPSASPTAPPATLPPTPTPPTTSPVPSPSAGETWLVMLYQNADDEVLERDIVTDLNEAELVGSTDAVTIVAQLDRFDGAYDGDGDWTGTRRLLIERDEDLAKLGSTELADLGEVDSGDWQTLADFAAWAIDTYPADRYALILSDHGAGWVGGWNDNAPREGSAFTTDDIDRALRDVLARTGVGQLDLLGFDACLMSQVEVLAAVAPYARVAVGSEEVEPALGWAYSAFLGALAANPAMDAEDLGRMIVESYIVGDARITDDDERTLLIAENFGDGVEMEAAEVAEFLGSSVTLTATRLDRLAPLTGALNDLAVALAAVDQELVAEARTYAQAYETVFDPDEPAAYLDVGHFAAILEESVADDTVSPAARAVIEAIDAAVIAEMHGPERPGSTGFTFFFPNSAVFEATMTEGAQPAYTASASRFAAASVWDDYLRFHYTGEAFSGDLADLGVLEPVGGSSEDPDALPQPAPPRGPVAAPGAGEGITIAPLEVSAEVVGVAERVTLTTEIGGGNVAYLYLYVSYLDPESGSYLTADMDFIGAEQTVEVEGVLYPDWGPPPIGVLEVEWEPTVFFMSNGEQEEFAFFEPQRYGATPEQDEYQVRGVITFADTGNQRPAVIVFTGDGRMASVWAYANEDGTGALREATLGRGDRYTIIEEWLDFDQNPDGELVDVEGATLEYLGRPFEMVAVEAYAGCYTLGIVVEDFDGNRQAEYVDVTVR